MVEVEEWCRFWFYYGLIIFVIFRIDDLRCIGFGMDIMMMLFGDGFYYLLCLLIISGIREVLFLVCVVCFVFVFMCCVVYGLVGKRNSVDLLIDNGLVIIMNWFVNVFVNDLIGVGVKCRLIVS